MSDENRKVWWNGVTQQVASTVIAAMIVGVIGLGTSYVILGSRVESVEKAIAVQGSQIELKADEATVLKSLADHESRIRASEVQASATSAALTEVRTDVRWIRETLEKRERGVR